MFLTPNEVFDIIIMTLAIGYIFSTFIKREPVEGYDPIKHYQKNQLWEDIKFGAMIAAPAVVLHELSHKIVAIAYGATATLHAPIPMYIIVIIMRLLRFPIIFLVGGYVSHTALPPLQSSMVALAGPLTNLLLFLAATFTIKYKLIPKKYQRIVFISGKLNLFLCIFNMLPIPGFDGFHFFAGLLNFFGF